jgi:hypothetical protein
MPSCVTLRAQVVRATDAAGNTAAVRSPVVVDTTQPNVTLVRARSASLCCVAYRCVVLTIAHLDSWRYAASSGVLAAVCVALSVSGTIAVGLCWACSFRSEAVVLCTERCATCLLQDKGPAPYVANSSVEVCVRVVDSTTTTHAVLYNHFLVETVVDGPTLAQGSVWCRTFLAPSDGPQNVTVVSMRALHVGNPARCYHEPSVVRPV